MLIYAAFLGGVGLIVGSFLGLVSLRLPRGAIYAFQQDLTAQAMFRVSSKSKIIKGLYITGSSAHPGGGGAGSGTDTGRGRGEGGTGSGPG